MGARRARRAPARDRHALGGPPHRARRLPPRRRPARLRRHGPARRVQARGLQALRGAARLHPPPGRLDDLPRQRPAPPAAAETTPMPTLTPQQLAALRAGCRAADERCRTGAAVRTVPAASGRGRWRAASRRRAARRRRTELLPGLAPAAPRRMQLQRGDRRSASRSARPRRRSAGRRQRSSAATIPAGADQARSSSAATAPDAGPAAGPARRVATRVRPQKPDCRSRRRARRT